jgi:hypothetical protein
VPFDRRRARRRRHERSARRRALVPRIGSTPRPAFRSGVGAAAGRGPVASTEGSGRGLRRARWGAVASGGAPVAAASDEFCAPVGGLTHRSVLDGPPGPGPAGGRARAPARAAARRPLHRVGTSCPSTRKLTTRRGRPAEGHEPAPSVPSDRRRARRRHHERSSRRRALVPRIGSTPRPAFRSGVGAAAGRGPFASREGSERDAAAGAPGAAPRAPTPSPSALRPRCCIE